MALRARDQLIRKTVQPSQLHTQQNIRYQSDHCGQQRNAQAGGQFAQHVLRLRLIKALHVPDLHGQHREADHLAEQT